MGLLLIWRRKLHISGAGRMSLYVYFLDIASDSNDFLTVVGAV